MINQPEPAIEQDFRQRCLNEQLEVITSHGKDGNRPQGLLYPGNNTKITCIRIGNSHGWDLKFGIKNLIESSVMAVTAHAEQNIG